MPRAKAFDHDQALDRAMRLFWRKGYEATSIDDLVRAMGINRASMYGAFGDKRRLFLAAMDRYVAKVSASRLADLRRPGSAKAAIRRYFQRLVEFSAGDGRRLGCLLTNAAIEMAPRDPTIEARLQRSFGAVEAAFVRVIRRGQARGEIDQRKSARAIARFLVGATQGIRVLARAARPPFASRYCQHRSDGARLIGACRVERSFHILATGRKHRRPASVRRKSVKETNYVHNRQSDSASAGAEA